MLYIWDRFIERDGRLLKATIVRMRELEDLLIVQRQQRLRDLELTGFGASLLPKGQTAVLQATGRILILGWLAVSVWRWLVFAGL